MPQFKKSFVLPALAAMAALSASAALAQGTSCRVLMFHEVGFYDGKLGASSDVYPDNFRDMAEFLKRNYNVISLDQMIAWRQGSGSIPTNAVVLTYDDNYEGVHDYARVIQKELGQTGVNFAHTGYVGVLTSRDHGDWSELNIEQSSGVLAVESHTVNHVDLSTTANPDFEITQSKADIQGNIAGKTVKYLAYPYGGYNSTIISKVQAAGYVAALTTVGGLNTTSTPIYELRRNGVGIGIDYAGFKSIMGYAGSDSGGPVIVDNTSGSFSVTGTWSTVGSTASNYGHYGANYRRAAVSASQTATARFTPSLPTAQNYDVFVWHASESDPYLNPSSVTHRVRHKTGTATVTVNQRIHKAEWVYLGRYDFNSGTSGYVEISNAASSGSNVCADAVKFMPTTSGAPAPVTQQVVDSFTTTGTWTTSTGGFPFGADCKVATGSAGAATATATYNVTIPKAGWYEVGVWFTTSNSTFRSDKAPYTVTHLDGSTTVKVNQQDSAGGAKRFTSLGTFRLAAGAQNLVQLTNAIANSSQYVSADGIRVKYVAADSGAPAAPEYVVDNTDAGFAASTNWFASTSTAGFLGTNYHARATASTSDAATWAVNLPTSGSYEVFARWTNGSNRATSAPFVVSHAGGSTTVNVNQQNNNGVWVSLGTYSFNSGTATRVSLSCWTTAGFYVVADAVKLVKQ